MLKNWIYSALVVVLAIFTPRPCHAMNQAKLTKTITKGYAFQPQVELEIHNKYGDVIVNDWNKDSVSIAVTITAYGKDEQSARHLLDRTEIKFNTVPAGIEVYTQLSKSDGWLKDLWNELNGYSQTIISKDQLTVTYQVYMPAKMDLEVNNKYGDLFLPDRTGNTRIELSNGNIKAEALQGKVYLDFKFGTADINSLEIGDLLMKSAELNLDQATYIKGQSNASTINLGQVEKVELTSRTDKIVIRKLNDLSGEASFSKLRVMHLDGSVDLGTNYGSLILESVNSQFSNILVRGKSTDVELTFDHMAYFNIRIVAKEGKFTLPTDHGLKQVYTDSTEKFIKSTGSLGKINSQPGEVNIDAQGGKVALNFAPLETQSLKRALK